MNLDRISAMKLGHRYAHIEQHRSKIEIPKYMKHAQGMVKETQMIARLKSSFSELFDDLYSRGLLPSPICEVCGLESESLEHVLNYCTGYIELRAQLYTILMRF